MMIRIMVEEIVEMRKSWLKLCFLEQRGLTEDWMDWMEWEEKEESSKISWFLLRQIYNVLILKLDLKELIYMFIQQAFVMVY